MHQAGSQAPSVRALADGLAALGLDHSTAPNDEQLDRLAREAGGEHVLRAALANLLYRDASLAAVSAEGHLTGDSGRTRRELVTRLRSVARPTSWGNPELLMTVLHGQAGRLADVLRALATHGRLGPTASTAVQTASALETLLGALALGDDPDALELLPRAFKELSSLLREAAERLAVAPTDPASLAGELRALGEASEHDRREREATTLAAAHPAQRRRPS